jgi:methylamine dehydrogenase heavy chain
VIPCPPNRHRARRLSCSLSLALATLWAPLHAAGAAETTPPPPLPLEQLGLEKLPAPDAYRLYVGDPTMFHLVDGRTHVVDARSMRYLGMLGTGFAGVTTVSRDGTTLYVATTYHSRLQRGTRTDVVEAYGSDDLTLRYEVEIPSKHVQSLPMRALMATTADDRFLLVQNATPATSVTVVDTQAHRVAGEIPMPGCYGVIPWPGNARRFSAVCGDGTITTVTLDDQGALAGKASSKAFFDPDVDPVFMHYQFEGDVLRFVSYHGAVHEISLAGDAPVQTATWSLVDDAARKQGWRPGGYELFAVDARTHRLYVGMHDHGREGSHKTPAKELWVFDLEKQRRVARWPGKDAISMTILPAERSRLVLLSGADNRLLGFDLRGDAAPRQPDARSEPIGETPVYLGSR